MEDEVKYRATSKGKQHIRLGQIEDIKTRLNNPAARKQALLDTAEWIKETALYFGASPTTAYKVAGAFLEGLETDLD